jgi:hypothetical protein
MSDVRIKIERAKKHVRDLASEIEAFGKTSPYAKIRETDEQAGQYIWRLKINREIPVEWAAIVGDAIHNARSALDILAWNLVLANGKKPTSRNHFPISESPEIFKSVGLGQIKGAGQTAIDLVERFQPYHSGNETLRALHLLDIRDKHQLIVPIGSAFKGIGLKMKISNPWMYKPIIVPTIHLNPADRMYPLQDGAILFKEPIAKGDTNLNPDYELRIEIALGEGQIVDGQPILPTLENFINLVETIASTFGREIFREN